MSDSEQDGKGWFLGKPQKPGGLLYELPYWENHYYSLPKEELQGSEKLNPKTESPALDKFFNTSPQNLQEALPGIAALLKGNEADQIRAARVFEDSPLYVSTQILELCKQDSILHSDLQGYFSETAGGIILSKAGRERFILLFNGYFSAGPDIPYEISLPIYSVDTKEEHTFNFSA